MMSTEGSKNLKKSHRDVKWSEAGHKNEREVNLLFCLFAVLSVSWEIGCVRCNRSVLFYDDDVCEGETRESNDCRTTPASEGYATERKKGTKRAESYSRHNNFFAWVSYADLCMTQVSLWLWCSLWWRNSFRYHRWLHKPIFILLREQPKKIWLRRRLNFS